MNNEHYFVVNFSRCSEYIMFGKASEPPRQMDGLFVYPFVFSDSSIPYEISLQENTIGNALKCIGWDSDTMNITYRVDQEDDTENAVEYNELVEDILPLQPGNHRLFYFTISDKATTK